MRYFEPVTSSQSGPMRSLVQSRFLSITSVGSLALAGVIGACSSSSPSGSPDSDNEGDGGTSSSGSSSGGGSSSSSGAGSSSSGGSGSSSSGGASSSGGTTDGGGEGGTTASGEAGADGGCPGTTPGTASYAITVHNFDNWCTVSLNGAAASVSSSYQACVPVGNSASIVVGPASSTFELGPNPFVRISGVELPGGDGAPPGTVVGDGGVGSTSSVNVGINIGPGCVLVCCPFTDGTGCDSSSSGYSTFLSACP